MIRFARMTEGHMADTGVDAVKTLVATEWSTQGVPPEMMGIVREITVDPTMMICREGSVRDTVTAGTGLGDNPTVQTVNVDVTMMVTEIPADHTAPRGTIHADRGMAGHATQTHAIDSRGREGQEDTEGDRIGCHEGSGGDVGGP